MLAIFFVTILGIVLKPIPMGTISLIGLTLTIVTRTLTFNQAFSGFVHPIVWLISIAFFISRGFIKTGLGERLAYIVIKYLGKSTLGMGYGMLLTDFLLAPAIPSVTARAGGIIYPISRALAKAFDSEPHRYPRKLGTFLMVTIFQGSVITSGMFLTSMAGNPLIANLAKNVHIHLNWSTWLLASSLPGLLCLISVPLLIYLFYPPEMKKTPHARKLAEEKLQAMGPMQPQEWIMLLSFVVLITLWIAGPLFGMEAVTAALIGLVILLLTSVLSWGDVIREKEAWNTLIWFATLIMMATFLNEFHITSWFSHWVQIHAQGLHWLVAFVLLTSIYFYSHYFFASIVAHVGAMYSPFLILLIALGTPPVLAAMTLGLISNLMGGLTHYSCGSAPIFFGSGYLKITVWWKIALYTSLFNLFVYLTVGSAWWTLISPCLMGAS